MNYERQILAPIDFWRKTKTAISSISLVKTAIKSHILSNLKNKTTFRSQTDIKKAGKDRVVIVI
jgi:hypothetical protein